MLCYNDIKKRNKLKRERIMNKKCVVFDLDGTLLNTLKDLNEACNFALSKYGYPIVSLEETKKFIGNGIKNLIEKSLKGDNTLFEEVFFTFQEYYFTNCNVYTKPYAHIYDLLTFCKQNKYYIAVLSNKKQEMLEKLCNIHFSNFFDGIVGDRQDIKKKPSPEGLFYIAKSLNISIKDIIYIGDSEVDVKTVKNANCRGVFVDYGFRERSVLIENGAEIVLSSPLEIKKYLEEL